MLLADELAIKSFVSCKGASGLKICLCCQNIANHLSPQLPDATGFLLPSTCLELGRFQQSHDAEAKAIMRRLRAAVSDPSNTQEMIKVLQRNLGYTYDEHSPMLAGDLDYKPISTAAFDWMHVYFVKGVFSIEVGHLVAALSACSDLCYESLASYCALWVWPKAYAHPKGLMTSSMLVAHRTAGFLKGGASEMLSLVPVLLRWVTEVVQQTDPQVTICAVFVHACCTHMLTSLLLLCRCVRPRPEAARCCVN